MISTYFAPRPGRLRRGSGFWAGHRGGRPACLGYAARHDLPRHFLAAFLEAPHPGPLARLGRGAGGWRLADSRALGVGGGRVHAPASWFGTHHPRVHGNGTIGPGSGADIGRRPCRRLALWAPDPCPQRWNLRSVLVRGGPGIDDLGGARARSLDRRLRDSGAHRLGWFFGVGISGLPQAQKKTSKASARPRPTRLKAHPLPALRGR